MLIILSSASLQIAGGKFFVNDIHMGCGFIILALVTFCEAKNELIYLVSQAVA